MQQQALSAVVAWVRLERAMDGFTTALRRDFGITPLQLAVLRILSERPQLPLAALRKALVMHPATLGQAIDALRRRDLCTVRRDEADRRARVVAITPGGGELLSRAPLGGPIRLRDTVTAPQRLDRLAAALDDALDLFGLEPWIPGKEPAPRP